MLTYLLKVGTHKESKLKEALKSASEKLKDKMLTTRQKIENRSRVTGRKEGKQEVARHMLSKGYGVSEVEQVTGFSRQELASLAE